MIVDFVISGFLAGLDALFSLFPTIAFFNNGPLYTRLPAAMGQVFPLSFLIGTVLICLAIRIALSGWDVAIFVYHQFWGSN